MRYELQNQHSKCKNQKRREKMDKEKKREKTTSSNEMPDMLPGSPSLRSDITYCTFAHFDGSKKKLSKISQWSRTVRLLPRILICNGNQLSNSRLHHLQYPGNIVHVPFNGSLFAPDLSNSRVQELEWLVWCSSCSHCLSRALM